MLRIRIFLSIFIISCLFSQEEQPSNYHISLSLHENLINDFFKNMGSIEGDGEIPFGKYKWKLIEPRIEIEKDTILFTSKIRLSIGDIKTHENVKGWVSSSYNQQLNKVILKIEEAKVIIDMDLFGKNIVITKLDIADYFDKPFKLDGPQPISENIEFSLPDGSRRQIKIGVRQSYMELVKDKILVKTSLDFSGE